MNVGLLLGFVLFIGMAIGIIGFIVFCKIYWFLRGLKEPIKQKVMSKINNLYRKVESL